ncbi:MAG: hypothetical protein JJ975_09760 [Bacteroidia bacterium]|nr:hypothetical protein [Bacteroidia bacterium]
MEELILVDEDILALLDEKRIDVLTVNVEDSACFRRMFVGNDGVNPIPSFKICNSSLDLCSDLKTFDRNTKSRLIMTIRNWGD